MRLVVTGASGGLGKEVVVSAKAAGLEVIPFPRSSQLDLLGPVEDLVGWWRGNIPDAVLHLAGGVPPLKSGNLFLLNVGCTYGLFESLAEADLRPKVIIASSAAVYGDVDERKPITVKAKMKPFNAYGAAKAAQELLAGVYRESFGFDVAIARIFNVVGVASEQRSVIPALVRRIRSGTDNGTLTVLNGAVVRDFIDVQDVAEILVSAAKIDPPRVFNVCTGYGRTVAWIAEESARILGKRVHFEFAEGAGEARSICWSVGDTNELQAMGLRAKPMDESLLSRIVGTC